MRREKNLQLDLVQTRACKERIERDNLGSPAVAPAQRRVGVAAVADDPRDVDQRLHVVHERGSAVQSPDSPDTEGGLALLGVALPSR